MAGTELKCPHCGEIIVVDVSGIEPVVHKGGKAAAKMDLSSFVKSQANRGKELDEAFRKAKEDQDRRKKDLDEQFFKAKQDPSSIKGDYISPFDLD